MNAEDIKEMKEVLNAAQDLITAYYIADDDTYENMFKTTTPALFRVLNVLGSDYDEFAQQGRDVKIKVTKPAEEEQDTYDENSDDIFAQTKCQKDCDCTCDSDTLSCNNANIYNDYKKFGGSCDNGTKFAQDKCCDSSNVYAKKFKECEDSIDSASLVRAILNFLLQKDFNDFDKTK